MKRMRIISLGGVAAAALAVGLPTIPAQAQTSVIPAGYSGSAQMSRPQPVHADPAMSLSAGPLALGIAGQLASARVATAKYATNLTKAKARRRCRTAPSAHSPRRVTSPTARSSLIRIRRPARPGHRTREPSSPSGTRT